MIEFSNLNSCGVSVVQLSYFLFLSSFSGRGGDGGYPSIFFIAARVVVQVINTSVWGYLVVGLITEPLGFVQDARDVMVLFDEWLGVLGSVAFVCWTIPLQNDTPVCHDCLVVNGTSKFIINISSRHGC